MIVYRCDICKTIHNNIGEMRTVIIRNSGVSHITFPQDGEFHICGNCEPKLLKMLSAYDGKIQDPLTNWE